MFMNNIIQKLNDASDFLYEIYLEVYSWPSPFWYPASFFYQLCLIFNRLAWYFYDFSTWVDSVAAAVAQILSWESIKSLILGWLKWVGDLSTIFYYFWQNVADVVTSWWSTTSVTVQGWIATAKQELLSLISSSLTWLASLQAAWDSFKGRIPSIDEVLNWFRDWRGAILAYLITWGALTSLQISSLIDSAFRLREAYWDGWQYWRGKVTEFFTDPLGWLESKFTDWFLGAE